MAYSNQHHQIPPRSTSPAQPKSPNMPKVKSFPQIMLYISTQVDENDERRWLFLKQDAVPIKHQQAFKKENSLLEFFDYLKKINVYTEENYCNILEDIHDLGLTKLGCTVEKMFEELHQSKFSPSADVSCSRMTISTAETHRQTPESFSPGASLMSQPSTLKSWESMGDPGGQSLPIINIPPSSQQPMSSTRKRPSQVDQGVSPTQKPCRQQEPSGLKKSAPTSPSQAENLHAEDNPADVTRRLYHPSDDPSIASRASANMQESAAQNMPRLQDHTGSAQAAGPFQQMTGNRHPTDEPSLEPRPHSLTSIEESVGIKSLKSFTPQPLVQPSSTGPPDQPQEAWPSQSPTLNYPVTWAQSHYHSHQLQQPASTSTEHHSRVNALSSTETVTYSQYSSSSTVSQYMEQNAAEIISHATCSMSLDEVTQLLSPDDSQKDGISMSTLSLDDVDDISDHVAKMQITESKPIIKEKKEEEKEKDDEDEKEKCEIDSESELEEEEVQNMPVPDMSNIRPETPDEECIYFDATPRPSAENVSSATSDAENIIAPVKKEETVDPEVVTVESDETSWPALAVAKKLSEEKAKKEEEESKIEYDPATGIEKTLFEKMRDRPETLSPAEHDEIKKQMMQHLQQKANPIKRNEPELPFDPEGRLSEYQKNLAVPGLMGFNYIMCAPSRTGKVLTAATVCNHQRKVALLKDDKKPFKVLFVTPEERVKDRHRRAFEEVFPPGAVVVLGSTDKFRAAFDQPSVNVVMMTGIRLAIVLGDGDLKFVEVHTMVVDDCHLVATNHPGYGDDFIKHYLLEKKLILARKAPRGAWTLGKPYGGISYVIGLSSHLGAGLRQFSRDNIVRQCGLLDSKGIRRVDDVHLLTDLLETNKPPQMDTMLLAAASRSSVRDTFRSVVEKIMHAMEENYTITPDMSEEGEAKKLKHPSYGTEAYAAWISPIFNDSKLCDDEEKYAPAMFLMKLNEVLMVNEDLRPKEAMEHFKEIQNLKTDHDYQRPTGVACSRMVDEQLPELRRISQTDRAGLTPKLLCLANKLAQIYDADLHALGLVICRCPAIAKHLTKIISENNITMSKGILPKHLEELGQCDDEADESRKRAQQQAIFHEFQRDGAVNLVVSTDFEQADLELPDCQFVIRYNVVCEEVGTVHYSGRRKARKELCFFISQSESAIAHQEHTKRENLRELEKHLKVLNEMDPKNWYDVVEAKQLACLRNNARRDFMVNYQRFCRRAADYTLHCKLCQKFICNAHFLMKRGTHMSCQDSSIKERLSIAGLSTPHRRSEDDTTGVLRCTGRTRDGERCQNKLGLAIDFKRTEIEEGYGLDCRAFFFSYKQGQNADYIGKEFDSWDDVDFFIYSEERHDRRGRRGLGGDDDDDDDDDNNRGGGYGDDEGKKKKKMVESEGASGGGASGGGGTRMMEVARTEETPMETETTTETRRRRQNPDGNVDR